MMHHYMRSGSCDTCAFFSSTDLCADRLVGAVTSVSLVDGLKDQRDLCVMVIELNDDGFEGNRL